MSIWENAMSKWRTMKPLAIALGVGLLAGPLISNYLGWQVTSSAARTQVRQGVVEQQALVCEQRARAAVAEPAKLDWSARRDLATKSATGPGASAADSEVTNACARKLEG